MQPPRSGFVRHTLALIATALLAMSFQDSLAAQAESLPDTTDPRLRHPGRVPPIITAVRVDQGPDLDGRLDDAAWRSAMIVRDFTQVLPEDGSQPTERTEVRVVYDGTALYIGARLYDNEPSAIVRRLARRDSYPPSDWFSVAIDSYHDHLTSFYFYTNAAGIRCDEVTASDLMDGDTSWDPVWSVATDVDSLGWTAEMRIPFSQLRFSGEEEQIWGITFWRRIFRKSEVLTWSWVPNEEEGYASHFGHLVGVSGVPAPRRLEVLPYAVATGDYIEGANVLNPFNDGSTLDAAVGLDLKYGVTSGLTLDATVNPDFGQVEADPAVVNLSAFETYFPERRPFFVEGANIFQFGTSSSGFTFGAPTLFYSRRIGRPPSVGVLDPDAVFIDYPDHTSIIAAGKLSGKTGGWSIGVLDALTARQHATMQYEDGTRASQPVEPLANYAAVSLRKDLRQGSSGIGVLGTSVIRDLSDPVFQPLHSSAWTGGMDFFHRFGNNQFVVNGSVSGSYIRGDPLAITLAQTSSARYYQRPDQDYVTLDTTRTSLPGLAGSMQAGKIAGNWLYATDFYVYSPGLEVNDVGFESVVDRMFLGFRVNRRWLDPGKVFRRFSVNATFYNSWNWGGTMLGRGPYLGVDGQFRNYWQFGVDGSYDFRSLSDKATRGGPLMEDPSSWSTGGGVGTDGRKPVSLFFNGWYTQSEAGGWRGGLGMELNVRPGGAMDFSIEPSYNRSETIAQYVTQRRDELATATYGGRYVFSELYQKGLDITIRTNLSLTPNLSVQLWAQPFAAAGDYDRFKELAHPSSFDFLRYGVDNGSTIDFDPVTEIYTVDPDGPGPAESFSFANPDFNVRSVRANLVIRWEYMPGSTLFLVWNHNRSGFSSDPTIGSFDQFGRLWDDNQQNTFLIKINYWISL